MGVVWSFLFFFKVVFGLNTRCALLFHWRGAGMHTGMPLRLFVDTHDRSALRCWQRRFVGVHSVHSLEKPRELWGCHTGYRDILRPEWKFGALVLKVASWPGYLIWILKSISAVFCLLSCFSFKLQAPPSGWMENDHWVFFFFPLLPFISIWGTMRCSCPPTCCEMWQRGPFSEKLAAISAIMLIFTCVPCRTEFSLCTETSPGNCCKTKTHQSTKAVEKKKAQLQIIPGTFHNDSV